MIERLYISSTETPGGARDWIINDIEIDDVSQLSVKDLPGPLFSGRGVVAEGKRATSAVHFSGLDVIEQDSKVAVTVTYIGPNPEGVPFYGAIVGCPPPQRPTVLPIVIKNAIQGKTTILAQLDSPLKMERLEIDCGHDGVDWLVHDIRVSGESQFNQAGALPGSMFSTSTIDDFIAFTPGQFFEIDIEYVDRNHDDGIPFIGRILGTVVRDNYSKPPPDVRAFVRTSGQEGLSEEVIARCNWRAPYVRPSAP